MRKKIRIALCLFLALGALLSLCACGSKSSIGSNSKDTTAPQATTPLRQSATGRYEVVSITWEDGTSSSGEQLQEALAQMGATYVELYSDYTALLCIYGVRSDMRFSESKMWDAVTGVHTYDISFQDGEVILKGNGTTYVFEKK